VGGAKVERHAAISGNQDQQRSSIIPVIHDEGGSALGSVLSAAKRVFELVNRPVIVGLTPAC